jgi:hypothetical protein
MTPARSSWRVNWIALVAAAIGGSVGSFLALVAAGGGHGTYLPAKALFPWTMLLTQLSEDTISTFGIALALIEFPAYAVILSAFHRSRRAVFVLVVLHCLAVLAALAFLGNFPP